MNDDIRLRHDVLLGFQVALLGMVTPSLRGVTVAWDEGSITGRLFYDGELADDADETASDVEAEIAASFPEHEVVITAERYDAPASMNDRGLMAWVYRRRE
jgi:hypothetical protein